MSTEIKAVSSGVYEVIGDLTFKSVIGLTRLPEALLSSKPSPTIRLNKVEHIDSAGLALLIDWARQSIEHQQILFSQPNDQLLRLLNLYNLGNVLPFDDQAQH